MFHLLCYCIDIAYVVHFYQDWKMCFENTCVEDGREEDMVVQLSDLLVSKASKTQFLQSWLV